MRAVIVEDEKPAIENLKYYLKDYPIEITGVAKNLSEAKKVIEKEKPEVIFLDIYLSGENGFDLFKDIDVNFKTIFVTAYDSFAIRAFEVNALDYILKPLVKERIDLAMDKLFKNEESKPNEKNFNIDDTIFLTSGTKACFSKVKDIHYIKAEGCYSKVVFTYKEAKVVTHTLKKWESLLPQNDFIRVNRTYIINTSHIKEIKKHNNGTYSIYFCLGDESIDISRRYASILKKKSII